MMGKITTSAKRTIIEDFAKEIRERRMQTAKPSVSVINFRDDRLGGTERPIYQVPIDILRFRKDNGRIASDVLDYETNKGILRETDDVAQEILKGFLKEKDPEKTADLRKSMMHAGQQEPAIITCDGFLINGNRRKMVMEDLHREHLDNQDYAYMKVVILPGEGEEGGPPTLVEIEKLENRYQLQSDGKSEYYGFDRALSIKRKVSIGLSLEEQLRDDPRYAGMTTADIEKEVRECERKFLEPLACVDKYLKQFRREGQYRTISSGMSDPEGRWQAFIDYSNTYNRHFRNPKRLIELGIEEDEIGEIEEAAFDIIRLRHLPDLPKVHVIMRDLPNFCRTKEGKKEIKKIAKEVEPVLPRDQCFDPQGNPLSADAVDMKWAANNREAIIYHTKKASQCHETLKEKETPIELLDAAYKKLTHENMDVTAIAVADYKKAMRLAAQIQREAKNIETQIYHQDKDYKRLVQEKG
ncbi:MAG: hypothetical protein IT365_09210 [Candidatus Hydrogenedentes bacterium]|nr:hypothetical protein [Candidatus Hydrogenedentota bacterium]